MAFPRKRFVVRGQTPTHLTNHINARISRRPFLYFGVPFVMLMVVGSLALSELTKTRYQLHDQHKKVLDKEEELMMDKNKRKLSLQEEYFVCVLYASYMRV
jgi:cytochrome c oxidase assembly protein subunit 16